MTSRPDADGREALVAAYLAGATAEELASRFGVTAKTVLNRLEAAGIDRRSRGRRPTAVLADPDWLRTAYLEKRRTAADIAREVGCTEDAVLDALHRNAIPVRGPGGRRRPPAQMPPELADRDWLAQQYLTRSRSIRQIARSLSVSGTAVANALRRSGIRSR